jgi:hypothetical protein
MAAGRLFFSQFDLKSERLAFALEFEGGGGLRRQG